MQDFGRPASVGELPQWAIDLSCGVLFRKRPGAPGLILSTRPMTGESLQSIVGRCLALNGLTDLKGLDELSGFGKTLRSASWNDAELEELEPLLNLPTGCLKEMQGLTRSGTYRWSQINHVAVPSRHLFGAIRRVSPASLRRSLHHRAVWALLTLPFCPESRELLVLVCPRCGMKLEWTPFVGTNRCGRLSCRLAGPLDLRDAPAERAAACTERALDFLCGFFHPDDRQHEGARRMLASDIAALSARDVYTLGLILVALHESRDHDELSTALELSRTARRQWGMAQAELLGEQLLEWPESFFVHCGAARDKSASRFGIRGAAKELGPIYKLVTQANISEGIRKVLRGRIHEEMGRNLGGDLPINRPLALPQPDGYVPFAEAIRLIGRGTTSGRLILANLPRDGAGDGRLGRVRRSVLEDAIRRLDEAVPHSDFARRLGILAKNGEFAARLFGIPKLCELPVHPVRSADLDRAATEGFVERLRSACKLEAAPDTFRPLRVAIRSTCDYGVAEVILLRSVALGRLDAHLVGHAPHCGSIRVEVSAAVQALREDWLSLLQVFDGGSDAKIGRRDLQMLLVCSTETADRLIETDRGARVGYTSSKLEVGQFHVRFEPERVRSFRGKYATIGELRLASGLGIGQITELSRRVRGSVVDSGVPDVALYDRSFLWRCVAHAASSG